MHVPFKGMNRMQYLGFVYNIPPYIKLWKMALLLPGYDPKRMDRAQKIATPSIACGRT